MFAGHVRLEAPGLEPFRFGVDPVGIDIAELDLGDAETRAVVELAPDADGTIDTTALLGARVITMLLHCDRSTWTDRQRLRAFTSPRLRPTLFLQLAPDAPEQRVTLRRSQFSESLGTDWAHAGQLPIPVQWIAPLGVIESVEMHEAIARAGEDPEADGVSFPIVFPLSWPDLAPSGSVVVVNAGTIDAYPVIRMYGPCEDPVIENRTQGKALVFSGLTIDAGEYVEIDTRAKTIRYESNAVDSRYDTLVFPTSRWWTLSPGAAGNDIRFTPDDYTAPAQAVILWRDSWL